jgi:eukaryotic-like serine/threonine-protein kinase
VSDSSSAGQLVGAVLNGRWRLLRLLGEGGMGAVYEADGTRGEGKRAIKLLHQEFVKEDQILQRFYAEAQATRALSHPNIAQVLDSATAEDGTPYLVMELLQGTPLSGYMDQGNAIPPSHAIPIIYGVLQALTVAHNQRLVHRDLKPDNLFLVRDARGAMAVKVLDFGIAKVMDVAGGMGQKTRTGVLLGTPGYMSPEQIKNSKGVDLRTDLWSVGIILYEMLTAKQPFPADNEFARLTSVLTEEVVPIEKAAPALAAWAGFFTRALAKEPAQRFQTADEMAQALSMMAHSGTYQPPGSQAAAPANPRQGQGQFGTVASMQAHPGPATAAPPQQQQQHTPPPQQQQHTPPQQQQQHTPPPQQQVSAHSRTIASTPPPPMSMQPMSAPLSTGPSGSANPTHVSARKPAGAPTYVASHAPIVEIIQPPPVAVGAKGAAWWIVGVVGAVAFGLGLALGLLLG